MRDDSFGLFWEDVERVSTRGAKRELFTTPMPAVPETGWVTPTTFPELRNGKSLCVDLETYDPELKKFGPGWARGSGHVLGIAIGWEGGSEYYPIGHEICPEENCDREHVILWLQEQLSNPDQAKLGANLMYDMGWLRSLGIEMKGKCYDVQYAEALIDEHAHVGLNFLSYKYLGKKKRDDVVDEWLRKWSGSSKQDLREYLYKAPPSLVADYAKGDVDLPREIMAAQYPWLVKFGLTDLFEMECALMPLFIAMREKGVRIDLDKAEQAKEELQKREDVEREKIKHWAGFEVNTNSARDLARAFDKLGLPYGTTDKGNPSIDKAALSAIDHPFTKTVIEAKQYAKARSVFVQAYLIDANVDGMVYGQFHALRGDEGGTRSGRMSASTPNLQNIPARDEFIGPLIRGLFVPDVDHRWWRRYDFSQIEYRFLAHFAEGPGSDKLRDQYRKDPNTDYHEFTQLLIQEVTGADIGRKATKNINFGLVYGMSQFRMATNLGLDNKTGKELFSNYHNALPFVSYTMDRAMERAAAEGVATTVLGRRSQFDRFIPSGRDGRKAFPLPWKQAVAKYGNNVERAMLHKALNRMLQGSAADQLKVGMLKCWKDGIFDITGVPRLTVHDELDFSDPGVPEAAWKEMQHIMESALPIRVPVIMDSERGDSWGTCVKY